MSGRFDWPGLLRVGCATLRLQPAAFWRLTPVELLLILGNDGESAPLNRERLEALSRAFPDERKNT